MLPALERELEGELELAETLDQLEELELLDDLAYYDPDELDHHHHPHPEQ